MLASRVPRQHAHAQPRIAYNVNHNAKLSAFLSIKGGSSYISISISPRLESKLGFRRRFLPCTHRMAQGLAPPAVQCTEDASHRPPLHSSLPLQGCSRLLASVVDLLRYSGSSHRAPNLSHGGLSRQSDLRRYPGCPNQKVDDACSSHSSWTKAVHTAVLPFFGPNSISQIQMNVYQRQPSTDPGYGVPPELFEVSSWRAQFQRVLEVTSKSIETPVVKF